MNNAFLIVTIVGLCVSLTFITAFHLKTGGAWRDSETGRWLMLFQFDITLLFSAIIANRSSEWWRGWSGRDWVMLALYTAFALQALWPLRLLWRIEPQMRRKGEERDPRT